MRFVLKLKDLRIGDVPLVGGKNASLGEMIGALKEQGIRIPDGFAITAEGYRFFIEENGFQEKIATLLSELKREPEVIRKVGKALRKLIMKGRIPRELEEEVVEVYREWGEDVDVAVRSSATAEDLPEASFAGQQESYLNIQGELDLLGACLKCFASLFTDRAITYREEQGFKHEEVALSVGVQRMVRSDLASSGVLFTIDTESGFDRVVVVNSTWGLGENIVQGLVTPDEHIIFKPLLEREGLVPIVGKSLGGKEIKMVYGKSGLFTTKNMETTLEERESFCLTDSEVLTLAKWGVIIEEHYQKPMDIEWAKDGKSGELFIVQARPETVQSQRKGSTFNTYKLQEKGSAIIKGLAIGESIVSGKPQVIKEVAQIESFTEGSILVTTMTDPDWVPIMKRAKGIITDQGGRTSHAAIVSRELGVPAIIGTGNATELLADAAMVTMSCAEGDQGVVYEGELKFKEEEVDVGELPTIKTQVMMNMASPSAAFKWWRLPSQGVGLMRMEFIISEIIKIHPMALVHFDKVEDREAQKKISELTRGYADKTEYFVELLALGIGKIACSHYPHPVIVRMSDFKTNEYANLLGGEHFEPKEENPMLGLRGASRYYHPMYREGFDLECRAIKRVRESIGLDNVIIMIPFCRTIEEAKKVLKVLEENGLKRGDVEIYVMAELPSNIILAAEFADHFDGFSIGSNDLTQLTLGVDRDSTDLAPLFDERNPAVTSQIEKLIKVAHEKGRRVGICGEAPSDYPEFAEFLVRAGIDSISLNPDSVIQTIKQIAELES
ncbi:MAG: Phosphoenolpyruvate synthase [Chlamydiae bacterium]|nr:Phosphoenolpyruvate synthase [Chlamydiota bacterium]